MTISRSDARQNSHYPTCLLNISGSRQNSVPISEEMALRYAAECFPLSSQLSLYKRSRSRAMVVLLTILHLNHGFDPPPFDWIGGDHHALVGPSIRYF